MNKTFNLTSKTFNLPTKTPDIYNVFDDILNESLQSTPEKQLMPIPTLNQITCTPKTNYQSTNLQPIY